MIQSKGFIKKAKHGLSDSQTIDDSMMGANDSVGNSLSRVTAPADMANNNLMQKNNY